MVTAVAVATEGADLHSPFTFGRIREVEGREPCPGNGRLGHESSPGHGYNRVSLGHRDARSSVGYMKYMSLCIASASLLPCSVHLLAREGSGFLPGLRAEGLTSATHRRNRLRGSGRSIWMSGGRSTTSLPGKGWNSRESTGTQRPAGSGHEDWRAISTVCSRLERIFTDAIEERFPGFLTSSRGAGTKGSLMEKGGEG